jgi:hypothetical protein
MPTGYTVELMEKGQNFNTFVMRCARAMGACVMMRDDSFDASIPEKFESSDYHVKASVEAKALHKQLFTMSMEEKQVFGEREKQKKIDCYTKIICDEGVQNERLKEMRSLVLAWSPPTIDHLDFKRFMINQIDISTHDISYFERELETAINTDPMAYYVEAISNALRDIDYHEKENVKEVGRTNGRNEWLKKLRESIGG